MFYGLSGARTGRKRLTKIFAAASAPVVVDFEISPPLTLTPATLLTVAWTAF
jgi:hypothetical protein